MYLVAASVACSLLPYSAPIQVYVICSILLFAVPKFSEEFDRVHRILILPYALPIAHVGLMGSVLCTVAIAVERFIAVHYPFLPHRSVNERVTK